MHTIALCRDLSPTTVTGRNSNGASVAGAITAVGGNAGEGVALRVNDDRGRHCKVTYTTPGARRGGVVSESSSTKIHLTVDAHGKRLRVICHPKFPRGLQADSKRSRRHDGRSPIFRKRQRQRCHFRTSPTPRNALVASITQKPQDISPP